MILTQVQPEHGGTERIHLGQAHHVDNVMYLNINNETYDDHYDYDHTSGDLNCYLYTTLWNHCWSNTTSFELGVKLTEVATGASYYWTSVNHIMLEKNRYYNPYPLGFNPHDLTYNGLYEVRPVCRKANNPDDEWIDIQESQLTEIFPGYGWSEVRDDPKASNGKAMWMNPIPPD